jgi:hypothetical protein
MNGQEAMNKARYGIYASIETARNMLYQAIDSTRRTAYQIAGVGMRMGFEVAGQAIEHPIRSAAVTTTIGILALKGCSKT